LRQVTDEMVKTITNGGGIHFDGFIFSIEAGYFLHPKSPQNLETILQAVSSDGKTIHTRGVVLASNNKIKIAIQDILQDIHSSMHLPESVYNNIIRLDTEHRCQNQKCNPAGKRRLLFVSAGPMVQAIQIKCNGCGLLNTFWKNRIDFDEYGALRMTK